MNNGQIKNTIQKFFELNVSKNTLWLFGKWFRMDDNQAEKDESMKFIWENSPSEISEETLEDWEKIKQKIHPVETRKRPSIRFFTTAAAAIAILLISTVFITRNLSVQPPVEYAQFSVSYDERDSLTLPDGTKVVINAGSTLIYPKKFTSDTRTVFLSGEANFNVVKNPTPFIVESEYIKVQALGTKFHVQSYPYDNFTKASLIEGSIKVSVESDSVKSFILKPNNQLIFSHLDNQISIIDVNAEKLAQWDDGYLVFREASFNEIAQSIERKYKVAIHYNGEKLSSQSYNITFNPNESLAEIMDVLTQLIPYSSYKIQNNTVFLTVK